MIKLVSREAFEKKYPNIKGKVDIGRDQYEAWIVDKLAELVVKEMKEIVKGFEAALNKPVDYPEDWLEYLKLHVALGED